MISSSSTTHLAVRKQGVCRGSLWRQELERPGGGPAIAAATTPQKQHQQRTSSTATSTASSSKSASGFWTSAEVEYCTVTANWLICHESFAAYERGDAPLHMYRIVGASSYWTGTTTTTTAPTTASKSFQLVTNQGKQLLCQAVTPKCRQHWLATLQAGLELTLMQQPNETQGDDKPTSVHDSNDDDNNKKDSTIPLMNPISQVLPPPLPLTPLNPQPARSLLLGGTPKPPRYCRSCGVLDISSASSSNNNSNNSHIYKPLWLASAPLWQYGMENRIDSCQDCFVAQGLLDHLQWIQSCMASALQEHEALLQARELCVTLVTPKSKRGTTKPPSSPTRTRKPPPVKEEEGKEEPRVEEGTVKEAHASPSKEDSTIIKDDALPETDPPSQDVAISSNTLSEPGDLVSIDMTDDSASNPQSPSSDRPPPPSTPPPPPPSSSTMADRPPPPSTPPPPPPTASDDKSSDSSNESWTKVDTPTEDAVIPTSTTTSATVEPSSPLHSPTRAKPLASTTTTTSSWIHISPTSKSTASLLKALRDKKRFGALLCASPYLEALSEDLLEGRIGVGEFLEQLDEAVGQAESETASLKKQAFRVAGDMGTAMKLLLDYALPPSNNKLYHHHSSQQQQPSLLTTQHATQMLQCLLEFFLDLCHDGELSSVAFFWPQLCHIHLCMLPPEDALAVARVDLMEDFLLTVASQYSIHLALELLWSHSADLEESLNFGQSASSSSSSSATSSSASLHHPATTPACRARRFAVLRFVCELESYLFGHDDGWGGGSVTLGKMLSPTNDQVRMLKASIAQIQDYRRRTVFGKLDRSVRHRIPLLQQQQQQQQSSSPDSGNEDAARLREAMVHEKLRIAKNADYFTSHLNFTKRVCDIAEKLRFMDVRSRAGALEEELRLLNASGTMGGDPLNRISDSMIRIVRVPSTEGHVFRSKERTPVLLLVEQVDEGAELAAGDNSMEGVKDKWDKVVKHIQPKDDETKQEDQTASQKTSQDKDDEDPRETNTDFTTGREETSETASTEQSPSRQSSTSELEGTPQDHRQNTKALKRFDGLTPRRNSSFDDGSTASTPKEVVDQMVTNVMVEQFKRDIDNATATDEEKTGEDSTRTSKQTPDASASSPSTGSSPSPKIGGPRRMFKNSSCDAHDRFNELAPTGDIRREVLNVIMMRGRKERNSIAAGAAESVQRSLKELETKRATALLLDDGSEREPDDGMVKDKDREFLELASTKEKLASLGLDKNSATGKSFDIGDLTGKQSEEDEVMEAVRLLLVQNRVAQGHLSAADAAKVLQHVSLSRVNSLSDFDEKADSIHPHQMPSIDAGDLDPRLAGCGPLPPAVLQALTLWKGEMVTNGELLELVKKDIEFVRHSVLLEAETVDKLKEDSAFWGRFAFGERWAEKKSRIAASSPQATHPGWDLVGIIVKSNDDLRQEAFVMQLIELCQEAFEIAGLELWVSPYRILATGRTTGIIEMVRNAMSFDALKKRPGYGKGGLREHLHRMTEFTADPGGSFKTAQQNFVRSLAAYSLMSYFFLFKDRHNGNLLLDTAGHVIHIDFGFVFGVAPGGSFSLEMSTPFKLTDEMLEVMGGPQSPLFSDFVTLFCCGFLALQSYSDTFFTLVEITSRNSTFKCFAEGPSREEMLTKLRERFRPELNKEETVAFALDLIQQSITSYGTRQYDLFQYLSQGIAS